MGTKIWPASSGRREIQRAHGQNHDRRDRPCLGEAAENPVYSAHRSYIVACERILLARKDRGITSV